MSLLDLPPELRLRVYAHVDDLRPAKSLRPLSAWTRIPRLPRICGTSRLIREETVPMYLGQRPIELFLDADRGTNQPHFVWFKSLGSAGVSTVGEIAIKSEWTLPSDHASRNTAVTLVLRKVKGRESPSTTWRVQPMWWLINIPDKSVLVVKGIFRPEKEWSCDGDSSSDEDTSTNNITTRNQLLTKLDRSAPCSSERSDESLAGSTAHESEQRQVLRQPESICAAILQRSVKAIINGDDHGVTLENVPRIMKAVQHIASGAQYWYVGKRLPDTRTGLPQPLRECLREELRVILEGGSVKRLFDVKGLKSKELADGVRAWQEGVM